MPELPEVETIKRGLEGALKGATIRKVTLRRRNLRIPFPPGFEAALAGRSITAVKRRAKYLLFHLDSEDVLIAHLGMTGRFIIPAFIAGSGHDKHDHVIFHLQDGRVMIFNDARRFGLMTLAKKDTLAEHPLFADLGPEPLGKTFSAAYLKAALAGRNSPIKVALMDQKLVVGVGNIYASEALFLSGIDPRKAAHKAVSKTESLIADIRKVLLSAIASGGSSLRDFLHISGEEGHFQHTFNVYGRAKKTCLVCQTPIRTIRQAGRSTFFCPTCQK